MAIKKVFQFLEQVRLELSRVEWPKFNEFLGATLVVWVLVCFFAVYLGAVDLFFAQAAKYVFKLYGGY